MLSRCSNYEKEYSFDISKPLHNELITYLTSIKPSKYINCNGKCGESLCKIYFQYVEPYEFKNLIDHFYEEPLAILDVKNEKGYTLLSLLDYLYKYLKDQESFYIFSEYGTGIINETLLIKIEYSLNTLIRIRKFICFEIERYKKIKTILLCSNRFGSKTNANLYPWLWDSILNEYNCVNETNMYSNIHIFYNIRTYAMANMIDVD
jgi:hypothetical protein